MVYVPVSASVGIVYWILNSPVATYCTGSEVVVPSGLFKVAGMAVGNMGFPLYEV